MSLSASDVARILADSRVMDAGQLDDLQPQLKQFADGPALTRQLVEWGWLTPYQAECVLTGHAPALLFGDYRLLEPIGQGGMGQVFRAAHLRLNRIVALKVIRPESLKTTENPKELIRRFQREAQAVAQLLHPNIVILFDYNEIGGTHFIAMEYVDGVDLAKMVQSQGPLPIPLACDYVRQAGNGLQHAYEFGMVHRDIKPSNLLVTRPSHSASRANRGCNSKLSGSHASPGDTPLPTRSHIGGILKILDMGLVRRSESIGDQDTMSALTMQGTIIGTPDFIAPEQARDASSVDIRADLYSLGCTFYFMLTGRAPFPNGTSVEKLLCHQNEQPLPIENIRPNAPAEVIGIVQRLMAKRPESRFQTPAELVDAIVALPPELLTGRARSDALGNLVAASAEVVQAERNYTPIESPTQMFSPDSLILPARKLAVLQGHKGYVTALEFSPDGALLASGGIDGTVRLWDVGMARPLERPLDQNERLGEVHHLRFAPNGKMLFSGSTAMDGRHWRWDWNSSNRNVRTPFAGNEYRTSCFAVSPDGNHVAAGSAAAVLVYDTNGSKRPTILKGHARDVRCVAYNNTGKRLFSAGEDRTIRLWEPGRFWSSQRATYDGHEDTVAAIALSPDGSLLASAGLDGTIRLWDASGESTDAVAVLTGHANGVRHVRFTANGTLLLSIGDGGQVMLWEVTESAKIREWQIDKSMMQSIASSADGRFIATGLNDGLVAYYDLELFAPQERPALELAGV